MSESITERREAYLASVDQHQREARLDAARLSRQMVVAMSSGEAFTADDFFFAATLGQPEDSLYDDARCTVSTLKGLQPREVVGVVSEEKTLQYVGITADPAAEFIVSAGEGRRGTERILVNRHLSAEIHFSVLALTMGRASGVVGGGIGYTDIEVLSAKGEPLFSPNSVFEKTKGLIVGSQAVIEYVSLQSQRQNDFGAVARLLDFAAQHMSVDAIATV